MLFAVSEGTTSACPQPTSRDIYIYVTSDAPQGQAIQGASVSGSIQWTCYITDNPGYVIEYSGVPMLLTPANGTVNIGAVIGNYSMIVKYSGVSYSLNFSSATGGKFTLVTLSLHSDDYSVQACQNITSYANCSLSGKS